MTLKVIATETSENAEITGGTAHASEVGSNNTAFATVDFVVKVTAVADTPNVTDSPSATNEDTPVHFGQDVTFGVTDTDGSEHVTEVQISAIPAGWTITLPVGLPVTSSITVDGSGTYHITSSNPDPVAAQAEIRAALDALTITPATDSHVDGQVIITVTSTDSNGDTASKTINHAITVQAVTDVPVVNDGTTTVLEDPSTPIAFGAGIDLTLKDKDGSQDLSVVLGDIPDFITLAWTAAAGVTVVKFTDPATHLTTLTISGADPTKVPYFQP